MKKKPNQQIEDINSINARHKFIETSGIKLALDDDGNIFIASSYDSLIRKIRDREIAIVTHGSKRSYEDQQRLDFLNVMFDSWESGFTGMQTPSPFIASAVGGAFKNVRDAIDSLMSDTKRIEVRPIAIVESSSE